MSVGGLFIPRVYTLIVTMSVCILMYLTHIYVMQILQHVCRALILLPHDLASIPPAIIHSIIILTSCRPGYWMMDSTCCPLWGRGSRGG